MEVFLNTVDKVIKENVLRFLSRVLKMEFVDLGTNQLHNVLRNEKKKGCK